VSRMRRFRSKQEAPRTGPSTVVGAWLRATLLDQRELARRLNPALNKGKPGWNDDEPAVAEAMCEIAVREYFGGDYDVRAITSFVSGMRSRIHSVAPPGQLETEALIRSALGETDVVTDDIKPLQKFVIRISVLGLARILLDWDEATIDQRIVEGERVAFERGWNPPLAA
jgi:hypothetical protein